MERSRLKLVLTSVLGLAILAGLIAYVGVDKLLEAVRRANPWLVGFSFLAYALFFVLRGARWTYLLRPLDRRVPVSETTLLTALGWLINTYVPMKAGDVARAALVHRRHDVRFLASASVVAVERTLDLVGLAALASVGLFLVPHGLSLPVFFERVLQVAWVLPVLVLVVLWVGARRKARFLRTCEACLFWLPRKPRGRILHMGETFLAGAEGLSHRPRLLLALIPLTLLQAAAQAAVFVFLFLAFEPSAPVLVLVAGVPFFLLSFIVAVTPGNVGTYEAAFAAVFIALGLPKEVVIPIGVLTHLGTTAFVTILGSISLPLLGLSRASLETATTATTQQVES